MLKIETLRTEDGVTFEEPDGELVEFIRENTNSIDVLTKVEPEKGGDEEPPVDPGNLTVTELEESLEDDSYHWTPNSLSALLAAEQSGKNRTTAVEAIEAEL